MRAYLTALISAALSLAATGAHAAESKHTLNLHQEKPALTHVDLGATGPSHGDMLAFEAAVSAEGGLKGVMFGMLITVDIAEGDDTFEDRAGQIFIDLGGGNSLAIAGKSVYANNSKEMDPGTPQIRAVIGGTGTYIGARGQITTTRNADGSYEHKVELLD